MLVFVWICWFVLKLIGNKNSDIPPGRYPHHKDKKRKRDRLIDLENCKIIEQGVKAINLWNKFIDCLPNKHKDLMTTTPMWLEEIDAQYPYVSQTPYQNFLERGLTHQEIEKQEAKIENLSY